MSTILKKHRRLSFFIKHSLNELSVPSKSRSKSFSVSLSQSQLQPQLQPQFITPIIPIVAKTRYPISLEVMNTEIDIWLLELAVWDKMRHKSNFVNIYKIAFPDGRCHVYRIGHRENKLACPTDKLKLYFNHLNIMVTISPYGS